MRLRSRRRWFVATGITAAVLLAAVLVVWPNRGASPDPEASPAPPRGTSTATPSPTFSAPPTASASPSPEEASDAAATEPPPPSTDEAPPVAPDVPAPGNVSVALTFADWNDATGAVEAAGFVSGTSADSGTCTLELSRAGADPVTTSVVSVADATTTSCPLVSIAGGALGGASEVTAVLTYTSPSVPRVISAPVTVRIG